MPVLRSADQLKGAFSLAYEQAKILISANKPVELICRKFVKRRTLPQNSFFHVLVEHLYKFYDETGFVAYDWLERNPDYKIRDKGDIKDVIKRHYSIKHTSELNTEQINELMEKVQRDWINDSHGEYTAIDPTEDIRSYGREYSLMGGIKVDSFPHNNLATHLR